MTITTILLGAILVGLGAALLAFAVCLPLIAAIYCIVAWVRGDPDPFKGLWLVIIPVVAVSAAGWGLISWGLNL